MLKFRKAENQNDKFGGGNMNFVTPKAGASLVEITDDGRSAGGASRLIGISNPIAAKIRSVWKATYEPCIAFSFE
jgi:hypothetical protein